MKIVIWFALVQSAFGAFDTLYFHEYKLRLPATGTARRELILHALRDFIYAVLFISLGWVEWHGWLALVFALLIAAEICITLMDFIEEDMTRKLPVGERIMHTLMAIIYGGMLTSLAPVWWEWYQQPAGFSCCHYGWMSWALTLFAVGVSGSGIRDVIAAWKLPDSRN